MSPANGGVLGHCREVGQALLTFEAGSFHLSGGSWLGRLAHGCDRARKGGEGERGNRVSPGCDRGDSKISSRRQRRPQSHVRGTSASPKAKALPRPEVGERLVPLLAPLLGVTLGVTE